MSRIALPDRKNDGPNGPTRVAHRGTYISRRKNRNRRKKRPKSFTNEGGNERVGMRAITKSISSTHSSMEHEHSVFFPGRPDDPFSAAADAIKIIIAIGTDERI